MSKEVGLSWLHDSACDLTDWELGLGALGGRTGNFILLV
jgi:hypothetical protein